MAMQNRKMCQNRIYKNENILKYMRAIEKKINTLLFTLDYL